jgi:hypothetical protein
MPTFEVEQYEIHTMTYQVQAKSEAQAIAQVLDGQGEPLDDRLDYIEVGADLGLSSDEFPELAQQLRKLGVRLDDTIIPSIRGVMRVDDDPATPI